MAAPRREIFRPWDGKLPLLGKRRQVFTARILMPLAVSPRGLRRRVATNGVAGAVGIGKTMLRLTGPLGGTQVALHEDPTADGRLHSGTPRRLQSGITKSRGPWALLSPLGASTHRSEDHLPQGSRRLLRRLSEQPPRERSRPCQLDKARLLGRPRRFSGPTILTVVDLR